MLLNLYNMGTGLIIGTLSAKYRGIAAGGIATHIEGLINSLHKKGYGHTFAIINLLE